MGELKYFFQAQLQEVFTLNFLFIFTPRYSSIEINVMDSNIPELPIDKMLLLKLPVYTKRGRCI